MMKRLISLVLCLTLAAGLCAPGLASGEAAEGAPIVSEEENDLPAAHDGEGLPASGVWNALSWDISADGVLTVSGAGDMEPFHGDANRPWQPYIGEIREAVFGEGITSIAPSALTVCKKLTRITLPSTLKTIGDGAFYGNPALENVTLPDRLEAIGSSAFADCTALRSITIPDSVEKLGDLAFWRCGALEYAVLGDGLTALGEQTFEDCGSLQSVTFGKNIRTVGQHAFAHCGITRVSLPEGLESLGDSVFFGCGSLTGVTVPVSVKSIGSGAFANDYALTTVGYDGTEADWYAIDILGGNDPLWNAIGYTMRYAGTMESGVRWELEGTTLTLSGAGAIDSEPWLEYASSVRTAVLEEGITEIGDAAFNNCDNLEKIYIPLSVTRIGFWAVHTVEQVEYPGTPEQWSQIEIGEGNAYAVEYRGIDPNYTGDEGYWTRVTVTVLPPSQAMREGIGLMAREGYNAINSVEYALSLELSTDGGVTWFTATERDLPQKGVVIMLPYPDGTSPEEQDFAAVWVNSANGWSGATPTKEADGLVLTINRLDNIGIAWKGDGEPLPANTLASGSFEGTDILWYVSKTGVLYIRGNGEIPAFALTGSGDTVLVDSPWYAQRWSIRFITLEEGITGIGARAFRDLEYVTRVVLPESVSHIDEEAFYACLSLTGIELPSALESIGDRAFAYCPLSRIELPGGLKSIGADCFDPDAPEGISVAPREGYDFAGWADDNGDVFTSEEIIAGAQYSGNLESIWLRPFGEDTFSDVSGGAWYYDSVEFVYRTELMVGVGDTSFEPGGRGTRAQVVTILHRLAGEPEASGESGFSDVPEGQWYSEAVAWAAENGITAGYEDGTFRPNQTVTRQEFVTLMLHMSEYLGIAFPEDRWEDSYLDGFPDAASVAAWARPAENWSVGVGFQSGSAGADGVARLEPARGVTRAELAAFLTRFCVQLDTIRELDAGHYLRDADAS